MIGFKYLYIYIYIYMYIGIGVVGCQHPINLFLP